jgi:beta-lactamase regulating signal transducer with metallopeptidase domain
VEALANWVWQGCAVTLAAAIVMRLSPWLSASTRYRLWWATLLIVAILPFTRLLPDAEPAGFSFVSGVAPSATVNVHVPTLPAWPIALAAGVWAAWSLLSVWRIAEALVGLRRAKRAARAFPGVREERLRQWLAVRDRGRRARLVLSDRVSNAAVLGLGCPAIAVAPHVLQYLDDRELDQILVHEWAHVQRRDDVTRLVQLLVVAIAGLHPAIWWIDRRLSAERETACDDWTINLTGSTKGYAACLAKLASVGLHPRQALLLPAAVSSSTLATRIVQLLDPRRNTTTRGAAVVTGAVIAVCTVVACAASRIDLVIATPTAVIAGVQPEATMQLVTTPPLPPSSGALEDDGMRRSAPSRPGQRIAARSAAAEGPASARRPASRQPFVPLPNPTEGELKTSEVPPIAAAAPEVQSSMAAGLPGATTLVASAEGSTLPSHTDPAARDAQKPTPWGTAADAGVSIGRGSQKAAVATAGFFTRLSKSIAGAF